MANKAITGMTEDTAPSATDLVESVKDPSGTPLTRKVQHLNLVKGAMGLGSADKFLVQEVLHDETLAAAGNFDVSSISQDYEHLLLILMARSSTANGGDTVALYLNNDTTDANYHFQRSNIYNASDTLEENPFPYIGVLTGGGAPSNSFGVMRIFLPFYASTDLLKLARASTYGLEGAGAIRHLETVLSWEDGGATAINRVTIQPDGYSTDEFVTNSRLRIIGIGDSS